MAFGDHLFYLTKGVVDYAVWGFDFFFGIESFFDPVVCVGISGSSFELCCNEDVEIGEIDVGCGVFGVYVFDPVSACM